VRALPEPSERALALADGGLVLDGESRMARRHVGRVIARWARRGRVAYIDHAGRRDRLQPSWPRHGAFVRATMPAG
jgi:hypothetical protein